MNDSHAKKFQKDLNAGLVALVLLAVLVGGREDGEQDERHQAGV